MKKPYQILFTTFICIFTCGLAFGQDGKTAALLVEEGIKLHDEGKYSESIEKYKEALKADPENQNAKYEMAYTYFSSGKVKEAIPILEKIIKFGTGDRGGAYDLLGSAYDDEGQPQKAIDTYLAGVKNSPDYQRLYFNLGITYNRLNKYAEAEKWAIESIKRQPEHASSHRLLGEVVLKQNRQIQAILAYSNFLLLEPQTERAGVTFKTLQDLLKKGVTKTGDKSITVTISENQLKPGSGTEQLMLSTSAASIVGKGLPPVEELTELLTTIYNISGELAAKKSNDFFSKFYTEYFYKLAQSGNMPAFARFISLSAYGDENRQWFKDNEAKLNAFSQWAQITKRSTE
ncbi:tetratricopeptide repeat protein [Mucilaginibacter limnophilus]|uniref:Tetratricopeptide repeat protein n=1 Tax=Mucilaginibacter limnophilus TaxID=1932778 RepID=A0A3S2V8R5_9SPHI|nr:tetratricopeptide repeat protein [Mucilaginibacter limnophilus]RVU01366.1 tetratricopeptide repeat protein [Mucilaginibacter limnophilus]